MAPTVRKGADEEESIHRRTDGRDPAFGIVSDPNFVRNSGSPGHQPPRLRVPSGKHVPVRDQKVLALVRDDEACSRTEVKFVDLQFQIQAREAERVNFDGSRFAHSGLAS
jgi:hypothetical protein